MNPYNVEINGRNADIYTILLAYGVTCPATAHAIKKLLCPAHRGGTANPEWCDQSSPRQLTVQTPDPVADTSRILSDISRQQTAGVNP